MGSFKMFLETVKEKKSKHRKIALFTKNKLDSIKKVVSKALIDFNISHEEFTLIINEEQT